mgnify:CR=1 FL=1
MKEIRFRCWIDINDEKFFGPGPMQLLLLVEQEGSIAKAAKTMGMSYKKAWDLINTLNSKGSQPYVISQKGGQKGGGAELTAHAKTVIQSYQHLLDKLESLVKDEDKILNLL